jgi:hypothetical protein
VCGKLLIRTILVLLFSFEEPWKKIKKYTAKKRNKKEAKKARRQHRRGFFVCFLFFCAAVLCDYLGVQARVSSTV